MARKPARKATKATKATPRKAAVRQKLQAFPIVGIGASAGGLQALESFFRSMPPNTGLGFVVVTHLGPESRSLLPEILARATHMAVETAANNAVVQPNVVYVMPPGSNMTIDKGRLRLRKIDGEKREHHPIDAFLASLATDLGERSVGIVLSGSGTDATLGVKAIKEAGGLTLAQGPDGVVMHPGMPDSAIASGVIDVILPVEAMPGKLIEYVQGFEQLERLIASDGRQGRARTLSPREVQNQVSDLLRTHIGHDFSGYKERTFIRRLQRRMQIGQIKSVDGYLDRLRQDPDEARLLFNDLLIGVTNFFRDRSSFEALGNQVIPRILEGRGADEVVRIWVPGCSTGEEIYSIAILVQEHLDKMRPQPRVQIFATDIDEAALGVARTGRYPPSLLSEVSAERLERFFIQEGTTFLVKKEVRDLCIFSSHSIIRDPPFSRIDLISCRNLLIYLNPELQTQVLPVFHYALRPGGYLFLGSAENVSRHAELFQPVDKSHRIFQRRDHTAARMTFPILLRSGRAAHTLMDGRSHELRASLDLRKAVEAPILERYAPAHVVVERSGEIVHFSPRTRKYLEAAAGAPTRELTAMARRELRSELRQLLREAAEKRIPVSREGIAVDFGDHVQPVTLTVEPMVTASRGTPLFLVVFTDAASNVPRADASREVTGKGRTAVEQLERELTETRSRLQGSIEEYETALEELKSTNEELVSVNEELQSTNEELETSKEELQSVNEELHTVNHELNAKVDELDRTNADLNNLFQSTQIATVFLDRNLTIRSFTPTASTIFNLLPGDRGRPLSDISSAIDTNGMWEDIRAVLKTGEVRERRISRRDARAHYQLRILPYRMGGNAIDGVVVTFIDFTNVVEAELHQHLLIEEMNNRVKTMLQIVTNVVTETLQHSPSPNEFADTILSRVEALSAAYGLVSRELWHDVSLRDLVLSQIESMRQAHAISMAGPRLMLKPRAAIAIGMVVHELVTNAVRHGALTKPSGRVTVTWSFDGPMQNHEAVIRWNERDGPEVVPPNRRGFGMDVIERQMKHTLEGSADFDYASDGLKVTLTFPAKPELVSRNDGSAG
jgi:two-component system CheB/CheR fusion protein